MSEKCPTCGSPVKIVGKTTQHYSPVDLKHRELLKLIHDDLLMRANIDSEGRKIVDISGFIWVEIKQALNDSNREGV